MHSASSWDPRFSARSPPFDSLADSLALLCGSRWPQRSELQELMDDRRIANGGGAPLRLVAPRGAASAEHVPYELRVFESGELEHRDDHWHDLFNALVWLTFPSAKAALNARHARELKAGHGSVRGRVRDALTLFDEEGLVVLSDDASHLELIREFRWKDLFWRRRAELAGRTCFAMFGHGSYQKALQPFVGLVGRAILLPVDSELLLCDARERMAMLDVCLAAELKGDAIRTPRDLHPVPLLGVPGWFEQGENEAFYDNCRYFRPGRSRAA